MNCPPDRMFQIPTELVIKESFFFFSLVNQELRELLYSVFLMRGQ